MFATIEIFLNKLECSATDDVGDDTVYCVVYKFRDPLDGKRQFYESWTSKVADLDEGMSLGLNRPFVFDMEAEGKGAKTLGLLLDAYDVEDLKFKDDHLGHVELTLTDAFLKAFPPGSKDKPKSYAISLTNYYGSYVLHFTVIGTDLPKNEVIFAHAETIAGDMKLNVQRNPSGFIEETPWEFLKSARSGGIAVKVGEIVDGALARIKTGGAAPAKVSKFWYNWTDDQDAADVNSVDNAYMPWSCAASLLFGVARESPIMYLEILEECLYHGEFSIGGGDKRMTYSAEDDLLNAKKMTDLAEFKSTPADQFYIGEHAEEVQHHYVGVGIGATDWVTLGVLATAFDPVICAPFWGPAELGCDPEQPSVNSSIGDCTDVKRFMMALHNLDEGDVQVLENGVPPDDSSANQKIFDCAMKFQSVPGAFLMMQVENRTFTLIPPEKLSMGNSGVDEVWPTSIGFDTGPGWHHDAYWSPPPVMDFSAKYEGEWVQVLEAYAAFGSVVDYPGLPIDKGPQGKFAYLYLVYFARGRIRKALIDNPARFVRTLVRG